MTVEVPERGYYILVTVPSGRPTLYSSPVVQVQ
jgi:hypothetical protein